MVPMSSHLLYLLLLLLWCSGAKAMPTSKKQPHILFVLADDLGFGDLGYTGSDIKTPVIDGLAKAGTIMGHYYVMQCCSPTRAALQTGRYDIRYGLQTQVDVNNNKIIIVYSACIPCVHLVILHIR